MRLMKRIAHFLAQATSKFDKILKPIKFLLLIANK